MKERIALRRWLSAATLTGLLSLVWATAAAAQDPAQFRIGYQKGSVSLVLAKSHRLLEERFPATRISWI
ncbi:TPA: aliphatic sulfonate ABC transporter substrate-binding protein, partial [Serratia marcescens]|nr:aliphatic sulfonate ABC transporter substrate-binding protein [Serratia marcescens]HEB0141632.1 aliphatic sulfonate ABC transporter substrate-binding protein [Serratia marcescens]